MNFAVERLDERLAPSAVVPKGIPLPTAAPLPHNQAPVVQAPSQGQGGGNYFAGIPVEYLDAVYEPSAVNEARIYTDYVTKYEQANPGATTQNDPTLAYYVSQASFYDHEVAQIEAAETLQGSAT